MEWTDIKTTVPAVWAETAEAIATGISGGGIYIEDYRDLEAQVEAIAHVDLIEQELLDKSRDEVAVHLYMAPDENVAEIGELMRAVSYTHLLSGSLFIRQNMNLSPFRIDHNRNEAAVACSVKAGSTTDTNTAPSGQ